MKWTKVEDSLPKPGENIIGLNIKSGKMEFGFRSVVDDEEITEDGAWFVDFHFPITHWIHCELPEG